MLAYFRHGFGDYIRANIVSYFIVILIFLIGIVMGAMAIKVLPEAQKAELVQYLNIFFSEIVQQTGSGSGILWATIGSNLKMILLIWVLGFTIIGIPFIFFLIFTRGFIIGFTVGFLVNEYVFRGLFFALVSIFPHNLLVVPLLLMTGVTAIRFSIRLIRRKNQIGSKLFSDSVNYSVLCFMACGGMVASALIEVYVSPIFMRLVAGFFV